MTDFQTKSDIRDCLARRGLTPQKQLGQNFLIDGNLLGKLLAAAEIRPNHIVVEIGAGTGTLTKPLARSAAHVVAAEIDRNLFEILRERLDPSANVTLLNIDALTSKHRLNAQLLAAIDAASDRPDSAIVLVANLPYNIATPVIANLLVSRLPLERLVFTVQSEVADRFLARPGTKAFGPVSILTQALCRLQRIATLAPHVFWPAPTVQSTMLRLDVHDPPFSGTDLQPFMAFVRAAFRHRRKTLRFNLAKNVSPDAPAQLDPSMDLKRRPETLSVTEWIQLARSLGIIRDSGV